MTINWLSTADPGAGLPVWVPKQLTTYPNRMLKTRITWLKNIAEREPLPPHTTWTFLSEFAAQRDFRVKVLSKSGGKGCAYDE